MESMSYFFIIFNVIVKLSNVGGGCLHLKSHHESRHERWVSRGCHHSSLEAVQACLQTREEQRFVNIEMYVVGRTDDEIGFRIVERIRSSSSSGLIATIEESRLINVWGRSHSSLWQALYELHLHIYTSHLEAIESIAISLFF